MITYVLSERLTSWQVQRYSDSITVTASGIPNEEDALEIVIREAKKDAPSQIMRIPLSGISEIIATFELPE